MMLRMTDDSLRAHDDPTPADLAFLEEQINEFNFATTGYRDGRYLAVFVRDADGAIRAGLAGHTWGGCAEVKFLWVHESERRSGLGSALLREAEREARARGCDAIVLSTHTFQAPQFYPKHGYEVCGAFQGYPRGYGQIFLRKSLASDETRRDDLGRAHELHGVQPVLPVRDVAASAAWFRDVLGFDLDFLHGDPPVHGRVTKGDGTYGQPIYIHLTSAAPDAIRPSGELRIHVGRDLDGLFAAYRGRGVEVVLAPVTQPWGLREFAVRDPNGHVLRFCGEAPPS
jgi:GNAT superfamily N-acetyltransferase/uncharacterized glyoxalase superfamily protein PhnB